ncbi:Ion transport protein-domain-containing protein [Baffinella frigidus]|nr:Ion transport protein-domain-containing protein [Cryptophyta sp. CCMP2293]
MFFLECFLKVFSKSFKVYIKSGWNRLDFLIVVTSAIDLAIQIFAPSVRLDIFKLFKILRALRPLRFVARVRKLRILASTISSAAKPVANTGVLALGVFTIFGVLFMQLLGGKMNSCSDPLIINYIDCDDLVDEDPLVINYIDCDDLIDGVKRDWVAYPVNFDWILPAIQSVFVLATQDDWPNHMLAGIDATDTRTGPFQNKQPGNKQPGLVIFYIATILLAGYLVVNIFVGVFVDCYQSAQLEMQEGQTAKVAKETLPPVFDDPPRGSFRGLVFNLVTTTNFDLFIALFIVLNSANGVVFNLVTTTNFDLFIALFIVLNVLSMAFESWKQSDFQNEFAFVTNYFFSFIFGWECIAKIYAFKSRRYFTNGWNKFDFFIVTVSFGGILIDNLGNTFPIDPTVLRILRVFRIFRILRAFRIFKAAKGLQQIIATLGGSLTSLMSLFMMLLLMFFIFSILGVQP